MPRLDRIRSAASFKNRLGHGPDAVLVFAFIGIGARDGGARVNRVALIYVRPTRV
jgi:hypothetical protein